MRCYFLIASKLRRRTEFFSRLPPPPSGSMFYAQSIEMHCVECFEVLRGAPINSIESMFDGIVVVFSLHLLSMLLMLFLSSYGNKFVSRYLESNSFDI